jgi:hypothetical protein
VSIIEKKIINGGSYGREEVGRREIGERERVRA